MRKVFLGLIVLLLAACATSNNGNSLLDTVSQESKIESAREDFTEKIEELTESGGLLADPQPDIRRPRDGEPASGFA